MLQASVPEEFRDKLVRAGAMGSREDEYGWGGKRCSLGEQKPAAAALLPLQGCAENTDTGQADSVETACRKLKCIFNLLFNCVAALPEFLKERKVGGEDSKPAEQARS